MKLKLKDPVVIKSKDGGEFTVAELTFRERPVSGDFRGLPMRSPPMYEDIFTIAGRLCAQPYTVMNNLSMDDMSEVVQITVGFMNGGPTTGAKPSP